MTQEKRLNRSRDALLGGVCAGVAEYFDVDPVVVRILVVVLTVASAGLLGVAYVAMWAVLPKAPEVVVPVEVEPQSVRSDTYGEVTAAVARGHAEGAGQQGASPAQAAAWRYASAAHVPPPPPPAAASASAGAMPPAGGSAGAPSRPAAPSQPVGAPMMHGGAVPQPVRLAEGSPAPVDAASQVFAAPTQPMATVSAPVDVASQLAAASGQSTTPSSPMGAPVPSAAVPVQPVQPVQPPREPSATAVKGALWLGSFLLFFGVMSFVATFVEGVSWWQYWPVIFVILGIVRMVVPAKPGHRTRHFVDGLVCFCVGGTLLPMSLGMVGWQTIGLMLMGLWPVLLMVAGLRILGGALKSPLLTLLAGACFAVFCVVGLVWYAVPGSVEHVVISAPYGRDYYIEMPPWFD